FPRRVLRAYGYDSSRSRHRAASSVVILKPTWPGGLEWVSGRGAVKSGGYASGFRPGGQRFGRGWSAAQLRLLTRHDSSGSIIGSVRSARAPTLELANELPGRAVGPTRALVHPLTTPNKVRQGLHHL